MNLRFFIILCTFASPLCGQERKAEVTGATSAVQDGFLADEFQRVDAGKDGWDTEVFYDEIKPRFNELAAELGKREAMDSVKVAELSHGLKCSPLRPGELTSRQLPGGITVQRPAMPPAAAADKEDFPAQVRDMLARFKAGAPVSLKVKIFRVTRKDNTGTATAYIDATGPGTDGIIQLNTTWETNWRRASKDEPWRITEIRMTDFEEVMMAGKSALFSECTEAVLGNTEAWRTQLRYGIDHWRLRIETALAIEPGGLNGVAIADVNGDGLEDLFYTDTGGLPKRLFLHEKDGTLRDVTREAGLDFLDRSRCALFVDFDNDGDVDLALALESKVLVLSNDGKGHFQQETALPVEPRAHTLAAADYDLDGKVDLYVCSYGRDFSTFGEEGVPTPWNDANNGAPNALFHNDGAWKFRNTTVETGLDQNNRKFSFAASWDDYDQDGWPDLYVANDFGRNNLYHNDHGKFTDVAIKAGADDPSPGMACSWGDVNGDGLPDIHVSNMFSGAGNRITTQPRYKAGSAASVIDGHKRFARGNSLLLNMGDGTFKDVSEACQITLGRWAWGNQMADVNNDGWPDLLTGNGFITGPEQDDL